MIQLCVLAGNVFGQLRNECLHPEWKDQKVKIITDETFAEDTMGQQKKVLINFTRLIGEGKVYEEMIL